MAKTSTLKLLFLFSVTYFLFAGVPVHAADLSFSPASGSFTSQPFSVSVYVSSPSQAINAVSGTVHFPKDLLNLVSVSKVGSIVSIWVQEPTFSNETGTINFEGIAPNPGFTGSRGNVLTLNFKGVGTGAANVKFVSGSVLANDGDGTNVLVNFGQATFSIDGSYIPPAPVTKVPTIAKKVAKSISDQADQVAQQPTVFNMGLLVVSIFTVILCLILMVVLCTLLGVYGWRRLLLLLNSIRKDIQKLKEADVLERKELAMMRQAMKASTAGIGRDLGQLKKSNITEDEELSRLRVALNDKTALLEREIQQLKEYNTARDNELASIKSSIQRLGDQNKSIGSKLSYRVQPTNTPNNQEYMG